MSSFWRVSGDTGANPQSYLVGRAARSAGQSTFVANENRTTVQCVNNSRRDDIHRGASANTAAESRVAKNSIESGGGWYIQ